MTVPTDDRRSISIVLVGNPNVGKSTVFNALTGLHHHTGNWTGKTVENAVGKFALGNYSCSVFDLPGLYSMTPASEEEKVAAEFILYGNYDAMIIVLDSVNMKRNLRFAVEVLSQTTKPAAICLNLFDEADKKGICINTRALSELFGVPVFTAAASFGVGLDTLKDTVASLVCNDNAKCCDSCSMCENCGRPCRRSELFRPDFCDYALKKCVTFPANPIDKFDRRIDSIMLSKIFSVPIMLLMLLAIFWITIVGANYPSQWLSEFFARVEILLRNCAADLHVPQMISSLLIDGMYATLTWVVSVMLPPMAIFFPLFTILEDAGVLPRIAFNMDSLCSKVGVSGKQSLTAAMGFGCNACGVTGCRIIASPKNRLIAILTNSFIPCNGRFPSIIMIITIFLAGEADGALGSLKKSALLLFFVVLSVSASLAVSKLLSEVLGGSGTTFVMELPPYRRPQFGKVIVRSVLDRTVFVLMRAVSVAAPAGIIIWLLANTTVYDVPVILHITKMLDPLGSLIGLDGTMLTAFLLGFPANEIVLPIAVMIYSRAAALTEIPNLSALAALLTDNGWQIRTAICAIILMLFHAPCSTTCLTIYKETKSVKYTLAAIILPAAFGAVLCFFVSAAMKYFAIPSV